MQNGPSTVQKKVTTQNTQTEHLHLSMLNMQEEQNGIIGKGYACKNYSSQ